MKRPAPQKTTDQQPASLADVNAGMFNMQAELLIHRLYLTQLVCYVAGQTNQADKYVQDLFGNMTDNVLNMNLPGLDDATAKAFRSRMQQFNRSIYETALASVTHPDNPAAKAGKIRR